MHSAGFGDHFHVSDELEPTHQNHPLHCLGDHFHGDELGDFDDVGGGAENPPPQPPHRPRVSCG